MMTKKEFEEYLDSIVERNPKTGTIIRIKVPELNYKSVSTWNFSKELKKIGLTRRQWVNIHKYDDINYLPICPYCGHRPLKFKMWDYRISCCEKECINKQILEQNTNPEFRSRISNTVKDLWKNEEYRKLQSESHIEGWKNEENASKWLENHYFPSYRGTRSKIYSEYENKIITFDSNWERAFFIFMKNQDNVAKIIRKVSFIKYLDSETGKIKRYMPDFIIEYTDGHKELIEIKPLRLINETNVLDKKYSAISWCKENEFTYKMITEIELRDLGVFDDKFEVSIDLEWDS